jgi:hypothetical protein
MTPHRGFDHQIGLAKLRASRKTIRILADSGKPVLPSGSAAICFGWRIVKQRHSRQILDALRVSDPSQKARTACWDHENAHQASHCKPRVAAVPKTDCGIKIALLQINQSTIRMEPYLNLWVGLAKIWQSR